MKYFYLIILKVICKLQIVVQKNCEYEQKYVYEGLYFLETVFAKFVPVNEGPVCDGYHGNQPNYLTYG